MQIIRKKVFEYTAVTNQIGIFKRIAVLRAYHDGSKIEIILHVATVDRSTDKIGDFTLGYFEDSVRGIFVFVNGKETRGEKSLEEFLKEMNDIDRHGLDTLLKEYAKESYAHIM